MTPTERVKFCKQCGKRLRIYEDLGSRFCGDCAPMPRGKIREYFRPARGTPGRREDPPGGAARAFDF